MKIKWANHFSGRKRTAATVGVLSAACAAVSSVLVACGGGSDAVAVDPEMPTEVKFQWFGYTNHHVQIGKVGVLMDAAYAFGAAQQANTALPARVINALKAGGATVNYMVLGHNHNGRDDHSINMPEVQRLTGAKYYAMASACTNAKNLNAECEPVKGGETIVLSKYVTMYPFRYIHGVECGATLAANGGVETIGYLFKVQTTTGQVAFTMTDSGVGGADAAKEVTINGENRGSALGNFKAAMVRAGVSQLDFQTMGPEQRYATQALNFLPAANTKVLFLTHNGGSSGVVEGVTRGYDLLAGLHYKSSVTDSPQLVQLLKYFPKTKFAVASNYFDAWSLTPSGFVSIPNAATKAAMGLPASGPGPLPQRDTSVRLRPVGDLDGVDCPADAPLFAAYP